MSAFRSHHTGRGTERDNEVGWLAGPPIYERVHPRAIDLCNKQGAIFAGQFVCRRFRPIHNGPVHTTSAWLYALSSSIVKSVAPFGKMSRLSGGRMPSISTVGVHDG